MILQLVTDGRRLAASVDVETVLTALERQAAAAAAAGVDFLQVREPWLEAGALLRLVTLLKAVVRGSGTRVIVNDRLDVAVAAGADGVQLKASSIEAYDARRLAPSPFVVGRSVHSAEEAAASQGVDYVIAGTVWPTSSKNEGHVYLGAEGLRQVVAATSTPVLAIGGVTLDRIAPAARSGAAGIAAIGLFMADDLLAIVADARRRFDTSAPAS